MFVVVLFSLDTFAVFSGELRSNQVCFGTLSGAFVSLVRSRLKQQSGAKVFGVVPEMCSTGSVRESISLLYSVLNIHYSTENEDPTKPSKKNANRM
eukprot:1460453-Amphidinium_carterae.1